MEAKMQQDHRQYAEHPLTRQEVRLDLAVETAYLALWDAMVKEHFPDAVTGDLSPGASFALQEALTTAIREWYELNAKDGYDLTDWDGGRLKGFDTQRMPDELPKAKKISDAPKAKRKKKARGGMPRNRHF
jgi:hypothetical protein